MRMTVATWDDSNPRIRLQPTNDEPQTPYTAVFFPKAEIGNRGEKIWMTNILSGWQTQEDYSFLRNLLNRLWKIHSSNCVNMRYRQNVKKEIDCHLLTILFASIRFFPNASFCLYLPLNLCQRLDGLATQNLIRAVSKSKLSYCYDIDLHFLDSNRIYRSSHSEVYKYVIDGAFCAIKIKRSPLTPGNLYLTNNGFQHQKIIQKTILGININALTFKSLIFMEYIAGTQHHGILPCKDEEALIDSIMTASRFIQHVQYPNGCFCTISQKIESCAENVTDIKISHLGKLIQEYWDLMPHEKYRSQLCLYDLHRDNLILNEFGWHIIDADSALLGTDSFMFSCLIAAAFLIEGYSPQYLLKKTIAAFSEDYERVIIEIIVRLYIGIAFFADEENGKDAFFNYMNSLEHFIIYLKNQGHLFRDSFLVFLQCLLDICKSIMNGRK